MRILITNDDGIDAPGLAILEEVSRQLAGPGGEVWVVAPETEQSGTGHCISFVDPMRLVKLSARRFKVVGTPADCVLAGMKYVLSEPPDLLLAGINRGNNSGENTLYSGTVGAAMEGALQGVKSIALSQYIGARNSGPNHDVFEASRQHSLNLLRQLLKLTPWEETDYRIFLNVNFPPCLANDVRGIRVATQGFRKGSSFSVEAYDSPSRRKYLWVKSTSQHLAAGPGSDVNANLANYISVTPMRANLTAHDAIQELSVNLK